jgi:exoribonuclease-2
MQRDSGRHRHDLRAIARRVMVERDLLPDFSPAVMAEVARSQAATAKGAPGVRDLRGLLWCSIDNDDSRDLDQLTVAEPMGGGAVRILVAVADVDAAVAQGSATDGHARHNTTSVYTAAAMFPMLPERLSTDLTSLGEGEDRVALVVEMTVNADGTVGAADLYRAVVKNRAKLAYNAVAAWLDATGPIPDRAAIVPGMEAQLRL